MRVRGSSLPAVFLAGFFVIGAEAFAQTPTPPAATPAEPAVTATASTVPAATVSATVPTPAPAAATAVAPAQHTYTVPAGTKILLQLRSAINTKSAHAGDGVYLVSTFPVVVGNRVMIPVNCYVQGVVDRVQRANHEKGRQSSTCTSPPSFFPMGLW